MKINRCSKCMEEIHSYPCPRCKFDIASFQPKSYALAPNTILHGRYLLGVPLGQGGFGITYIAWDLAEKKKVAIKELYPSGHASRYSTGGTDVIWSGDRESKLLMVDGPAVFRKEAAKMQKLKDVPQVVQVCEVFTDNNTAYIVMDFVAGITLKDYLMENGPLNWDKTQKLLVPAIEAMIRVHKAGLIHRDISPDNMMIEPSGKIRILDLGAAKDLNTNSGASSMIVAKGGFSPLEQYSQRGGSGTWTDVYALAATICYTLSGKTLPASVDRVNGDADLWEQPVYKKLPPHVLAALQKALAVSPKDRTQTMEQFLSDLRLSKPDVKKTEAKKVDAQKPDAAIPKAPNPEKKKKSGRSTAAIVTLVLLCCVAIVAIGIRFGSVLQEKVDGILGEWSTVKSTTSAGVPPTTRKETVTTATTVPPTTKKTTPTTAPTKAPTTATTTAPTKAPTTAPTVPGYLGDVDGYWGEEISVNGTRGGPYILEKTLNNCTKMTLYFQLNSADGWYQGTWRCLFRMNGRWEDLQGFAVPNNCLGDTQQFEFTFDTPITFDAIFVKCPSNVALSCKIGVAVREVYVKAS